MITCFVVLLNIIKEVIFLANKSGGSSLTDVTYLACAAIVLLLVTFFF